MTLTVLQNSGILERLEELWDFYAERPAVDQDKQIPSLTEITEREASVLRDRLWEAIALLKASREALGGLFGELMNPDVVIARIPLSDEPLDRAAAVMKALDGADVHARIGKA